MDLELGGFTFRVWASSAASETKSGYGVNFGERYLINHFSTQTSTQPIQTLQTRILHLHSKLLTTVSYFLDTVQDHITAEMSEAPPQLGEIPQQSEMSVPTLSSTMDSNTTANGGTSVQNAKDSIYSSQVSSKQPIDRLIQG